MPDMNVHGDKNTADLWVSQGLKIADEEAVDSDLYTSTRVLKGDTLKPSGAAENAKISFDPQEIHLPSPSLSNAPPAETVPADPQAVKGLAEELYFSTFQNELEGLTDKQKKLAVLLHNDPTLSIDDPAVKAAVDKAEKAALSRARTVDNLPPDWTPSTPDSKTQLDKYYDQTVKSSLLTLKGESDGTLLELAFYHPEFEQTLSAEQKAKLANLKALVKAELGFTPPVDAPMDSYEIDTQVALSYNQSYEKALDKYAKDHSLSPKTEQFMKTMHYHPEVALDLSPELKAAHAELEKLAIAEFKTTNALPENLPAGWPKTQADPQYDGMIRSNYRFLNERNMKQYLGNHPEIKESDLRAAIANIDAPGLSENVKAAAREILGQSKASIKAEYGFVPELEGMTALWNGTPQLLNALNYFEDLKAALESRINAMPNSPEKQAYFNFLQVITRAVHALQQQIYEMEQQKAQEAHIIGQAQMEASKAKVEANKKNAEDIAAKQKEVEEKQKKAGVFGEIMKIVSPIIIAISIIATVCSAMTLGPVATAVILALTAVSIAEQANLEIGGFKVSPQAIFDKLSEYTFGAIAKACGLNVGLSQFIGKICIMLVVLMYCTKPAGACLVGGQIFMQSGASKDLIEGSAKAHHGEQYEMDQKTLMIASVATGAAVMIGAGIGAAASSASAAAKTTANAATSGASAASSASASGASVTATASSSTGATSATIAEKAATAEKLAKAMSDNTQAIHALQNQMVTAQTAYDLGRSTFTELAKVTIQCQLEIIGRSIYQAMLVVANSFVIDPKGTMRLITIGLQVGTAGVGMANAIVNKQMTDIQNDIIRMQANTDVHNLMMDKFIAELRKLIKELLAMLQGLVEWLPELSEMHKKALISIDYSKG